MPEPPDNIPDLLARLARALHEALGVTARSIDVHTVESDRPLPLPVPVRYGASPRAGDERAPALVVNPVERRILRAVADLDADNPTGEEIAEQAKLPYESHLKKTLAAMRVRGLLAGGKGETGYPITPAGLAALEPEGGSGD